MKHGQTIAMARGLLAEGRAADVARMIEPLVEAGGDGVAGVEAEGGDAVLRALLARVRLLRYGDPHRARALLVAYDASAVRAALPPAVRAEVALWLGWTYAWQDAHCYDGARALSLLDEAARLFREALSASGQCWTRIGQAYAYFTMDEYPLMLRALEEAAGLQEKLQDAQAEAWLHDLQATAARYHGQYTGAQAHADALLELGRAHHDPHLLGRAHAYRAVLLFERGRPTDAVIAEATEAVHLLTRAAERPGYPLLVAYHTHLGALLRRGDWQDVPALAAAALVDAADLPTAPGYIDVQQARAALLKGDTARARAMLDGLQARLHRQHRLLTARALLVEAALCLQEDQPGPGAACAARALRLAREAGHEGLTVEALLTTAWIAVADGDGAAARAALHDAEQHAAYFSLLPLAAPRFHLLGRLALLEDRPDEARAYLTQALSAFSLLGDAYRTAQVQLALAACHRTADPVQGRPLLDAARRVFERLPAPADAADARALADAWPAGDGHAILPADPAVGASLARASISVDLTVEAWLQAVERWLPETWLAVYRWHAADGWHCLHAHGPTPARLAFPAPTAVESRCGDTAWLRLRRGPGPAFFLAARCTEQAWAEAQERMKPWLPIATLALDHALLQALRLDAADRPERTPDDLPVPGFLHASPAMREVTRQVWRIRASHSPVLITGEGGTGKELLARAVHATSERKSAPFLAFPCATTPPELFDSHLFGHEEGAFAGAERAHPGVLRAADGGTVFLDEIADVPPDVQSRLLRFLEEGEVFPLGARRPTPVNVRVVAATGRDLEALLRDGRFREDLYYRLNVVPLRVPPLRARREEIPLLVRHFLHLLRPAGAPLVSITNRALDALMHYDWPGNVRQLRNELERALLITASEPAPLIDLQDLSPAVARRAQAEEGGALPVADDVQLSPDFALDDVLSGTEKTLIQRALTEHVGHVSATAQALGITRQGLYKKLRRLGIDPERFRTTETAS